MTTGTFMRPNRRSLLLSISAIVLIAALIAIGLLMMYTAGSAHADVGSGSGSGSGSAIVVDAVSGAGSIVPAPPSVVSELSDLRKQYEAIKSAQDKDTKMLLWAGLIAAVLKSILSLINKVSGGKPKKWMAWIAMGLAVPIALLSHYALGNSVFDSLVYAGAGPGAVVLHELLKVFFKPDPTPEPAKT